VPVECPCNTPTRKKTAVATKERFTAEVTLPSDTEVRVVRSFHAPRTLVWQAHTVPELMRRWLGCPGWSMPVCEMDVRPGGESRWRWRLEENGQEFGFFGTRSPRSASLRRSRMISTTIRATSSFPKARCRRIN
jgi:hypothetical protein